MTGKLLAYRLKSPRVPLVVRVPQFENHCARRIRSYYLDAETSSVSMALGYLRSNAQNRHPFHHLLVMLHALRQGVKHTARCEVETGPWDDFVK